MDVAFGNTDWCNIYNKIETCYVPLYVELPKFNYNKLYGLFAESSGRYVSKFYIVRYEVCLAALEEMKEYEIGGQE